MRESVITEPEHEPLIRRSLDAGAGTSVRAAGAVLWRAGASGTEVGLVHRPKYDDWTFPKGKLKNGEHLLRAAVREVREETGITPRLGRRLPATRYLKNERVKQVEYWAATGVDGGGFVPNDEVDRLHWLPIREAARLLSYHRDVRLLDEFGADPCSTVPLIIVRHGAAAERRGWSGPDVLRPLNDRGRAQAVELADLLAVYAGAPVRLLSSAAARCVETLIPYALNHRTSIATEHAFTLGDPDEPPEPLAARQRLAELLDDDLATVVCTHGELVDDLVAELGNRLGDRPGEMSDGTASAPTSGLEKGSFEVAHLGTGEAGQLTLKALERHSSE